MKHIYDNRYKCEIFFTALANRFPIGSNTYPPINITHYNIWNFRFIRKCHILYGFCMLLAGADFSEIPPVVCTCNIQGSK